ncbi:MAG TPA: cytochrome P450, partial [Myxococcaceae bacterium]|nr:cytochrome P450 [Myxococcaceae bacterium]
MSQRINLLSPEIRADPYPTFAELRRNTPVCQVDPGGLWAVTRYADAMTVFKNSQAFSSEAFRKAYRPEWCPDYPLADSLLVMDPPRHGRLRTLIGRAFGSSALSRWEPRVKRLAQQAAAELPMDRPVDFIESFALRIPAGVVGELLGLPEELHPRLKKWSDQLGQFTGIGPDEHSRQEALRATLAEIRGHFEKVIADRRHHPADDMVTDLLNARVEGEELTPAELMGFLFVLLVAGLETTMILLCHSALRLRDDPELMARLRADPSLIPRFIEEMLRYESPVHGVMRLVTQDVELGGVLLPRGSRLLVLMNSINRDEAQFPGADRFELDRPGPQNLPFGHGVHFCLGAPLARLEARYALEALLARCSRFSAGEGQVEWTSSLSIRGPLVLPLVAH